MCGNFTFGAQISVAFFQEVVRRGFSFQVVALDGMAAFQAVVEFLRRIVEFRDIGWIACPLRRLFAASFAAAPAAAPPSATPAPFSAFGIVLPLAPGTPLFPGGLGLARVFVEFDGRAFKLVRARAETLCFDEIRALRGRFRKFLAAATPSPAASPPAVTT